MKAFEYRLSEQPINPPRFMTGRYLAHAELNKIRRAYIGADLVTGAVGLIRLTRVQAAYLVKSNITDVRTALRSAERRELIEAGVLPFVRPHFGKKPAPTPLTAEEHLFAALDILGINGVLDLLALADADRVAVAARLSTTRPLANERRVLFQRKDIP